LASRFKTYSFDLPEHEAFLAHRTIGVDKSGGCRKTRFLDGLLEEIADPTAADVVALMSFTGLRQSEARGLHWPDWKDKEVGLHIRRSVWRKHVGPTKNIAPEESIPVLPLLRDLLRARKQRIKPGTDDYIFAGSRRGAPLDFDNLVTRQIKPALENAKGVVNWSGWHGFRRGLASNFFGLGVPPKVVQAIMRRESLEVTLGHYIMMPVDDPYRAMNRLEPCGRKAPT
jgi:integrase